MIICLSGKMRPGVARRRPRHTSHWVAILSALLACTSMTVRAAAPRTVDPDAVALAAIFTQAAIGSVAESECDSRQALQVTVDIGLGAWVSHDPSLTEDKVRDLRRRLHDESSRVSRQCTEALTSALLAADGPFGKSRQTVAALFDAMEPKDRTELYRFFESQAGREFARVLRGVDEVVTDAWMKWISQQGTIVFEQFVKNAAADLRVPPPAADQAMPRTVQSSNTGGDSASSPPIPPSRPQARIAPARLLEEQSMGAACQSFYPVPSRMLGEEGAVTVLVYIADDGRLTSLQIESSSGYPALDVAAAACIGAAAKFKPLQQDGQAVGSWQRLRWIWKLST